MSVNKCLLVCHLLFWLLRQRQHSACQGEDTGCVQQLHNGRGGEGLTLCTDAERCEGKARLEGAAPERRECPLPSLLTDEMETKVLNRQTQGRICPWFPLNCGLGLTNEGRKGRPTERGCPPSTGTQESTTGGKAWAEGSDLQKFLLAGTSASLRVLEGR